MNSENDKFELIIAFFEDTASKTLEYLKEIGQQDLPLILNRMNNLQELFDTAMIQREFVINFLDQLSMESQTNGILDNVQSEHVQSLEANEEIE